MITSDKKFLLMTNNEIAVERLKKKGVEIRYENHSYHSTVEELPQIPSIEYKQYKLKPISPKDQAEFEIELQRLKDIEEAIDKINATYDAQIKLVEKMVSKKGLKLKPHCPKDSIMFSVKHHERLHFKTSLKKIVDQEAIKQLAKKHPQLNKCFRKKVKIEFDRLEFDKIVKTLPAEAIEKIITYDEVQSVNHYDLPGFECTQCGGNFTTKGICKYCGQGKQ